MKTSIFDMNFVLPPVVEMTEVMKNTIVFTPATAGYCICHTQPWECGG